MKRLALLAITTGLLAMQSLQAAEVVAEHVYFGDSKRSESDTPSASGDFREIPEDEEGELPF